MSLYISTVAEKHFLGQNKYLALILLKTKKEFSGVGIIHLELQNKIAREGLS